VPIPDVTALDVPVPVVLDVVLFTLGLGIDDSNLSRKAPANISNMRDKGFIIELDQPGFVANKPVGSTHWTGLCIVNINKLPDCAIAWGFGVARPARTIPLIPNCILWMPQNGSGLVNRPVLGENDLALRYPSSGWA